jgi:hypothetical protein
MRLLVLKKKVKVLLTALNKYKRMNQITLLKTKKVIKTLEKVVVLGAHQNYHRAAIRSLKTVYLARLV